MRVYGPNDPGTLDLQRAYGAELAEEYKKNGSLPFYPSSDNNTAEAYWKTINDSLHCRLNITQAYVGGYSWYARRLPNGSVEYVLSNSLDMYSPLYHLKWFLPYGGKYTREQEPLLPGGIINQTFTWYVNPLKARR